MTSESPIRCRRSVAIAALCCAVAACGLAGGRGGPELSCTNDTCAGCCNASGACISPATDSQCGVAGASCLACGADEVCTSQGLCRWVGGAGGSLDAGPAPDAGRSGTFRVFITRSAYSGNLRSAGKADSGTAGADALCSLAAQAATLGGTWTAWVSTPAVNAYDRNLGVGPWYTIDAQGHRTLVFNNRANLATMPLRPICSDENGHDLCPAKAWTGTTYGGGAAPFTCSGWSSMSAQLTGTYGSPGRTPTSNSWTSEDDGSCSDPRHLLCFER